MNEIRIAKSEGLRVGSKQTYTVQLFMLEQDFGFANISDLMRE